MGCLGPLLRPWQGLVSREEKERKGLVWTSEASFLCWSRLLEGSGEGSRGRGAVFFSGH